jgi:hypothetical protein
MIFMTAIVGATRPATGSSCDSSINSGRSQGDAGTGDHAQPAFFNVGRLTSADDGFLGRRPI